MASPDVYADFVLFTVQIVAGSLLGTSLARCCMVDEFATMPAFPGRTKLVTGTPSQMRQAVLDLGFAATSSTYKMVAAFANNVKPIGEVMIGRIGVGEDYTDGLDAIAAADDSFFAFCVDTRVKARQKAALDWAQLRKTKFYITTTADPLAIAEDPNSLPMLAKAAGISFGMIVWYDPAAATGYGPAVLTSAPGPFAVPNGGTLFLSVSGGAQQPFVFESAAAQIVSGTDGPYNITAGTKLYLRVDQGPFVTVTFQESALYFPNLLAAATAEQVKVFLNDLVAGLDCTTSGDKLVVRTARRGTGAHVEVFGAGATALDLAASAFQVTRGTAVPSAGAVVGLTIDALPNVTITSPATAADLVVSLIAKINLRPDLTAILSAAADGDDIVLSFKDHDAHTVQAVSPGAADITPIADDATPVDAEVDGSGFAVNADAATGAEVAAVIQATISGAAAVASGTRFTVTSTASGSSVTIDVVDGTLVDEFGLALGPVAGTGVLENYLDCQLTGRVAGFDLDAPNGSVGWDNQTVPQTPGNVLTNTQRQALWRNNCNTYEAVTSNRPGELHRGVTPAGFDCDVVWSAFWFRVRGSERVKAMQDGKAARGERIPYTEAGIVTYDQVLRGLMLDGARNGHIQGPELRGPDPLGVRKAYFKTPTIAEQTSANRAIGRIAGWSSYQLATGSAKAIQVDMTIETP